MSILSQVTQRKKFEIKGVYLEIKSPHVDGDVEILLEGDKDLSMHDRIEMQKRIIKAMLKDSIPDATEEEINDCLRLDNLLKFIDIFYEVSGLTDEENISNAEKIKSAIEQRRESIAKSQATK